jgi:hypothetical protein
MSEIWYAPDSVSLKYAIIYGEVPRFKWLPRFLMRWKWFRKTDAIAWMDGDEPSN